MAKYLLLWMSVFAISGCADTPHLPFTCPDADPRYVFERHEWDALPKDVQDIIASDEALFQKYIRECEARARIHNGDSR